MPPSSVSIFLLRPCGVLCTCTACTHVSIATIWPRPCSFFSELIYTYECSFTLHYMCKLCFLQGIVVGTGENSQFGEVFKMMQAEEVSWKLH